MNIELKKANPENIPTIFNLAVKIWMHHYVPMVGLDQVEYMLVKMYSAESLTEQMTEKGQDFYLIYLENDPIGFTSISQNQSDYFIHKFYVDQDIQGKGVGSIVFQKIQNLFSTASSYMLTVNRQNFTAINFYFKNGFVIDHIDDFDIGSGFYMNDFIMKWTKKRRTN